MWVNLTRTSVVNVYQLSVDQPQDIVSYYIMIDTGPMRRIT